MNEGTVTIMMRDGSKPQEAFDKWVKEHPGVEIVSKRIELNSVDIQHITKP